MQKLDKVGGLTLVLGGARSGKSAHAEGLLAGLPVRAYIATAAAHDDEMARRIAEHRAARGPGWRTIEVQHDLSGALAALTAADGAVLVDCLTLWLSNRMLAGANLADEAPALIEAMAGCAVPVVAVSNEVGLGLVPETPLGRRFRDAQGALNRMVAASADRVVFVAAGLPLVLKGGVE